MELTKTRLMVGGLLLLAVAVTVVIRAGLPPPVKESDFQLNWMHFQTVPKNLLVVRPTQFTNDPGSFAATTTPRPGQNVLRMIGRDVPLEQVIAAAYGANPSRIVLPVIKPKTRFDYLVTVPTHQLERFQAAVKKKLGYTAHWEDRDTDVLLLETTSPNPPGFRVSNATNRGVTGQNGKYWFIHMQPGVLVGFLEYNFRQPVLDQTGLTNYYDFSFDLNWRGRTGPDPAQLEKALGDLGLKLEPATESTRMLVVEEVR